MAHDPIAPIMIASPIFQSIDANWKIAPSNTTHIAPIKDNKTPVHCTPCNLSFNIQELKTTVTTGIIASNTDTLDAVVNSSELLINVVKNVIPVKVITKNGFLYSKNIELDIRALR